MCGLKQLPGLLKQQRDAAAAAASLLLDAIETEAQAHKTRDSSLPGETPEAKAAETAAAEAAGAAAAATDLIEFAFSRYMRFCCWHVSQYFIKEKQLHKLMEALQHQQQQQQQQHASTAEGGPSSSDPTRSLQQVELVSGSLSRCCCIGCSSCCCCCSGCLFLSFLFRVFLPISCCLPQTEGTRELANLSFLVSTAVLRGLPRLPRPL